MARRRNLTRRKNPTSTTHADLRAHLEAARLDLRALFRAADHLRLGQDLPDELHALLELDADFAEALWVLDQPQECFDLTAMEHDTLASLHEVPAARQEFLRLLTPSERRRLADRAAVVRSTLTTDDAYFDIPGPNPQAR
jgi:hypothetical protein